MSCFFFYVEATTQIYTLSLHDALPISERPRRRDRGRPSVRHDRRAHHHHAAERPAVPRQDTRSEEHTSELQSPYDLVCRLLLEKKNCTVANTPADRLLSAPHL